ncbi:MATE family efflux transporter [Cytobacillus sp. FSL R7-0680]|uniref:MATE family efflux transporter n=1 Tax=Cytobacillus sp. FSL R7-0680 TaxID=2921689 RepID=UPI0030F6D0D4
MYHAETWNEKIKLFLQVLWPIMVTQIGLYAMNLTDTMMSGRVGTDDLAGVAIGSNIWMPVFTGINGIMLAITPIVSHLLGQGKKEKISYSVTQALYLAAIIAVIILLIGIFFLEPILSLMGLAPNVEYIAFHYLLGLSIGIVPLFLYNVLRNFFDAQGFTQITMIITILAVPVNIFLNYCLVFGHFGFPRLGGVGAGYTTGFTYWFILIISILISFKIGNIRNYKIGKVWFKPSIKAWREQLSIGIPIGLTIFFESSIFAVVTLLVGMMFSTITVAANQVAFSFTSLLFMIPLSLSMAMTIMIGYSVGGRRLDNAKKYSLLGVIGGMAFMGFASIFLLFFKEQIAAIYSNDPQVILLAANFFVIAIFYQISDAAQAGLQGVLRGYKDVKIPFIIAFISYWVIGIPVGYGLAAFTELEAYGFWIGISVGLTAAAIGFYIRLKSIHHKEKEKQVGISELS